MTYSPRFILLPFLLLVVPGCWQEQEGQKKSGLVVVNVLEEEFYKDCHITGSLNMPFERIDKLAEVVDKEAQIVIYCSNYQCTSSEYAAKRLKQQGFSNVCVYEGGIAEWYQQGLPVEGEQKKAYLKKPCRQVFHKGHSEVAVISVTELAQKLNVSTKDHVRAA